MQYFVKIRLSNLCAKKFTFFWNVNIVGQISVLINAKTKIRKNDAMHSRNSMND